MKKYLLILACITCYLSSGAQLLYADVPVFRQVYPRNVKTNFGEISIRGAALKAQGFSDILVEKYREGVYQQSFAQTLTYINDSGYFQFKIPIKAELADYSVKIYGVKNGKPVLDKTVDSLLAGDAFIIQGQSNAVANKYEGTANRNASTFIRVWGSSGAGYTKEWFYANGDKGDIHQNDGNAGQWGLRLARRYMDAEHIPVVIFNGARGGMPIDYFLKKYPGNNYGKLLARVTESGFRDNIRAIFWYQGESDSNPGNSTDVYKRTFDTLYTTWKWDYKGFEKLYIIQVKPSCLGDAEASAKIQEAHRQLADSIPGASIMSTHGLLHYSPGFWCHYPYDSGYKQLGDYLYLLVNRDVHHLKNARNVEPPYVTNITQTAPNKLTLQFKNEGDTYFWEAGTENDFVVHGVKAKVIGGNINGSSLILTLNKNINVDTLSFYGHQVGGSPTVRNASGEGIVGFYKMLVSTAAGTLAAKTSQNNILKLAILPNPVHSQMNLQYKTATALQVSFVISDNAGRKILVVNDGNQPAGGHQKTINVNNLQPGYYKLEMIAGSDRLTQNFIKQ